MQYPFEFAKTRAQLKGNTSNTANPFTLIAQTIRTGGVSAIYAGCSTLVVVRNLFQNVVRFSSNDI